MNKPLTDTPEQERSTSAATLGVPRVFASSYPFWFTDPSAALVGRSG
jgi:hypothetical protein